MKYDQAINKKRLALLVCTAIIIGMFMPMVASAEVDMGWLNDFFGILTNAIESMGNLISNAFSGIFSALQSWLNPVLEWFGDKLHAIGQAIGNAVSSITGTLQNMWNAIKQFFAAIFKPILDLVYGFLYLIWNIFQVIKLVIILLANVFLLFVAIATGFINTITGLTNWTGGSDYFSVYDPYQQGFTFVIDFMGSSGLNLIAGIAAVGVWLITAYASIKLATGGAK